MTDASSTWKRLRLKTDPTVDDPDWRLTAVTPNTVTATVGGTTTAGVYSITVAGTIHKPGAMASQLDVNFTATFTRAAETDTQIADNLDDDFDAGVLRTGSTTLLSTVGITADNTAGVLTIRFPPYFYGTVTASAPAPGTIVFTPGSTLPVTASAPHYARAGLSSANGITVEWNCFDDIGGTVLLAPSGGTMTLQAIELAEVETVDSRGDRTYRYVTMGMDELASTTPGTPYEIPLRGAKYWTVRMLTDAALPAGTESVEVIWRDSAT